MHPRRIEPFDVSQVTKKGLFEGVSPRFVFFGENTAARKGVGETSAGELPVVAPDHDAVALDREEEIFGEEIGVLSTGCVGETRDVPRVVRVPRRGRHRARWAGDVRE
jgi:hypothetical protein